MKNRFRSTGFWLSLTGAILIVIQQLGISFGFNVNSELVNGIVSSVCGCLVMLGILIPTKQDNQIVYPDINLEEDDDNVTETVEDKNSNNSKIDNKE